MTARAGAAVLVAVAGLIASGACGRSVPRSVVVISVDTLRADRLGCYGNPAGLTPNLDRLAEEGVLFEDATAPVPVTLPSHASMFTGRYPTEHGVRNNGTFVLPAHETTLAERLREAGWSTGAVVAAFPLARRFGLAQGFERYDDALPGLDAGADAGLPVHFPERDAIAVTDRALETWRRMEGGRRFLWVHYFDPHAPYAPPPPHAPPAPDDERSSEPERQAARYDGEVAFTDEQIGRLLGAVLADDPDAVVAVVADHGEGLGDHDEKTHGIFLYQSTLRVPFLLRAPGRLPAGVRLEEPVSLVDLAPTLLALAGLEPFADAPGADLAPLVGGGAAPERPVYAESLVPRLEYRFAALRALRRGTLKYIDAPEPELYDVDGDPAENDNLFAVTDAAGDLAERLEWFVEHSEIGAGDGAAGPLDAEAEARLRSLGYVASGAPASGPDRGRDPKTMTAYFLRHDRALGLVSAGRFREGVALLRELIPLAPENYLLRYQIGGALLAAGDAAGAERELERLVIAAPEFAGGHLLLGQARFHMGHIDEAAASLREGARVAPASAEPLLALGTMLESAGRFAAAADALREAVERTPELEQPASRLVELLLSRGETERAARELRELCDRHPGSAALWTALATAERRRGAPQRALDALGRALEIEPRRRTALLLAGEIQLEAGNAEVGEAAFRRILEDRPDDVPALFALERALLEQDRVAEADAIAERLLALDPAYSPALTARAMHRERSGQLAAAAEDYRRALRINPADRQAREGLARLSVDR